MNSKTRRVLGTIFGMVLGLAYGVVSQWINRIFLPDIPLYVPPPGRFATVLLEILGGGAIGLLVTWPKDFFVGVLISSVTGTLVSSVISLRTEAVNLENTSSALVVLFITFLPRVVVFLPVTILVRWVVNTWEKETLYTPYSLKGRLRSVLLLVVVGLVAGIFSLYSGGTRQSMKNLNELILEGRQASSTSSLPQPLQRVNDFLKYSKVPYTLNVVIDPEVIPVPQPAPGTAQNITAIEVLFSNGFRFGCVYPSPTEQPSCIDY